MGIYSALNTKPYIGRIKLNTESKIEPVKLNIKRISDYDLLNEECFSAINLINKELEEIADKSRKQYELFILFELFNRGYDLQRLENSNCWRRTVPNCGEWDREEFYVDDMLVLTVNKRTRFEDVEHKYMIYTDFEVE